MSFGPTKHGIQMPPTLTLILTQGWSFERRVVLKNKLPDCLGTNPRSATYLLYLSKGT